MEKRKGLEPAKCVYLVFYYLFLLYWSFAVAVVYLLGEFNLMIFVYGRIYIYFEFGALLLLWVLPVILRKKRSAVMLITLTALLAADCFIPGRVFQERVRAKYSDFSYEDWTAYPIVRTVMYEDLKDSEGSAYIIGKTAEEAKEMLGEPDFDSEGLLKYNTTPSSGSIEIRLQDNIVTNVAYPLD